MLDVHDTKRSKEVWVGGGACRAKMGVGLRGSIGLKPFTTFIERFHGFKASSIAEQRITQVALYLDQLHQDRYKIVAQMRLAQR